MQKEMCEVDVAPSPNALQLKLVTSYSLSPWSLLLTIKQLTKRKKKKESPVSGLLGSSNNFHVF